MKTVILAVLTLFVQGSAAQKTANEYVVGVKDVLQVVVRGFEDFSLAHAIVDADGMIEHPELGRIPVAGKTEREIEDDIKSRFIKKAILTKVALTVTVKEYRSQMITIIGDGINKPGTYPVQGNADLLQAIGTAGGFTTQAGSTVIITHRPAGQASGQAAPDLKPGDRIEVLRTELEMGRAPRTFLRDGDTIYVPKAEVFFIQGAVRSPGEYVLRRDLTMGRAVVIAGDYTDRARKGTLEVERIVNGKVRKLKLKEGDFVMPGDRIKVPSRWW